MTKHNSLLLVVVLIVMLFPWNSAVAQMSQQTNLSPPLSSDCQAGDPTQSPLYDHHTYLTFTQDGLSFDQSEALVLEHASVPDIVVGPDGALWVYYVNGQPGQHGIFAARKTENGDWQVVDCVKLDGEFNGNAVDPNITRLPDGRYRLVYYLGVFVGGTPLKPGEPHPIYSAISDDGINFTIESQLIAVEGVTDPSMIQLPDGSWLLAMTRPDETLLAASQDGRNFELTGTVVEERGIPELALLPDGHIALYIGRMYISDDFGQTWALQPDIRVPGGGADPSMTSLPEGGFAFAFKKFTQTIAEDVQGSTLPANDFTPCSGYGDPMSEQEQGKLGPWASRLMLAFSEDGLVFSPTDRILSDQADVPDAILMPNGEIRVYYVTMCPEEVRNKIVVAVTRDAIEWAYKTVQIEGLQDIQPIAVDPTVEFAPDGRIRMYFTSSPASPGSAPQSYSAISGDGYSFVMESGARFGVDDSHVLDPTVLLIDDTWHYFAGGLPGTNYHAVSPDGLTFTQEDNVSVNDFLFANGIAVPGGYRYYGFIQQVGTAVSSIYSVFTADGQTWQLDEGVRLELNQSSSLEAIGVKDPAVVQMPDGRYLMIYSTVIPEYPVNQ